MSCHRASGETATKHRFSKGFLSFLSQHVDLLTIFGQSTECDVRSSMHRTDFLSILGETSRPRWWPTSSRNLRQRPLSYSRGFHCGKCVLMHLLIELSCGKEDHFKLTLYCVNPRKRYQPLLPTTTRSKSVACRWMDLTTSRITVCVRKHCYEYSYSYRASGRRNVETFFAWNIMMLRCWFIRNWSAGIQW